MNRKPGEHSAVTAIKEFESTETYKKLLIIHPSETISKAVLRNIISNAFLYGFGYGQRKFHNRGQGPKKPK